MVEVFAQVCGIHATAVLPPFLPVAAACEGLHQHLAGLGQEIAGQQWLDVFFIGMRARIGIEQQRHPRIGQRCLLCLRQRVPGVVPFFDAGKSGFGMGG